ncbi:MAG: LolA family protein [Burkholderiales bacterium]
MTTGARLARGAVLGVLLATAPAFAIGAEWGMEHLMGALAAVKKSQAGFVERKQVAILNEPLESRGRLVYVATGRLEKHTLSPRRESLVLDGDELTLESGDRNQRRTLRLQEQPVVRAFVESIRATLAGDLATLNSLYAIRLEGTERQWRLILKPGDRRVQEIVSEIRIGGSRDAITRIEFFETGGDRTVMTITRDGA